MTTSHLTPDEIATFDRLPAGDARRSHADACARCFAELAAYRRFMASAAPGEWPAADVAAASQVLRRAVSGELDRIAAERLASEPPSRAAAADGARSRERAAWIGRPAMVAGATLVAIAVAWFGLRGAWQSPTLRGVDGETRVRLERVTRPGPDRVAFSWRDTHHADGYRVRVLDVNLRPVAEFEAGRERHYTWNVAAFRDKLGAADTLYWQALALEHGDVVAESPPEPFALH